MRAQRASALCACPCPCYFRLRAFCCLSGCFFTVWGRFYRFRRLFVCVRVLRGTRALRLRLFCFAHGLLCRFFFYLRVFRSARFRRLTGFSMGPEILPMKLSPAPLRGWSCCFAGASPNDVNFVIFLILFSAKLTFLSNNTGALSQFTQE